jgi:hypothetical protein
VRIGLYGICLEPTFVFRAFLAPDFEGKIHDGSVV